MVLNKSGDKGESIVKINTYIRVKNKVPEKVLSSAYYNHL